MSSPAVSRRLDKDFPDIVHLFIENGLDALRDLQPLCERFGTPTLYDALCARIRELQS